jgi:hypothetical protein
MYILGARLCTCSQSDPFGVACELMRQEQAFRLSVIVDLLKTVTFLNAIFLKKLNTTGQPCNMMPC